MDLFGNTERKSRIYRRDSVGRFAGAKQGEQRIILLESKQSITRRYSDFEYEQLIKYYKAISRKIRKEKGI